MVAFVPPGVNPNFVTTSGSNAREKNTQIAILAARNMMPITHFRVGETSSTCRTERRRHDQSPPHVPTTIPSSPYAGALSR